MSIPVYSTLFSTLYDENEPVGQLGRGTHYSILRSVEWLDTVRQQLSLPEVHDFCVIWDEDHDTRVIEAIERIYMAGLLSPIQFIGERKGMLTIIVSARFYFSGNQSDLKNYLKAVEDVTESLDDYWPVSVGSFDRSPESSHQCITEGVIAADDQKTITYLKNIDNLWNLGTKKYKG